MNLPRSQLHFEGVQSQQNIRGRSLGKPPRNQSPRDPAAPKRSYQNRKSGNLDESYKILQNQYNFNGQKAAYDLQTPQHIPNLEYFHEDKENIPTVNNVEHAKKFFNQKRHLNGSSQHHLKSKPKMEPLFGYKKDQNQNLEENFEEENWFERYQEENGLKGMLDTVTQEQIQNNLKNPKDSLGYSFESSKEPGPGQQGPVPHTPHTYGQKGAKQSPRSGFRLEAFEYQEPSSHQDLHQLQAQQNQFEQMQVHHHQHHHQQQQQNEQEQDHLEHQLYQQQQQQQHFQQQQKQQQQQQLHHHQYGQQQHPSQPHLHNESLNHTNDETLPSVCDDYGGNKVYLKAMKELQEKLQQKESKIEAMASLLQKLEPISEENKHLKIELSSKNEELESLILEKNQECSKEADYEHQIRSLKNTIDTIASQSERYKVMVRKSKKLIIKKDNEIKRLLTLMGAESSKLDLSEPKNQKSNSLISQASDTLNSHYLPGDSEPSVRLNRGNKMKISSFDPQNQDLSHLNFSGSKPSHSIGKSPMRRQNQNYKIPPISSRNGSLGPCSIPSTPKRMRVDSGHRVNQTDHHSELYSLKFSRREIKLQLKVLHRPISSFLKTSKF